MKRCFFIRHGESEGNIDHTKYASVQNLELSLTELGYEQAYKTGLEIRKYFEQHPEAAKQKTRIYYSPLKRTIQTLNGFRKGLGDVLDHVELREDPLITEIDHGMYDDLSSDNQRLAAYPHEVKKYNALLTKRNGGFFARKPLGERPLDLFIRTQIFKNEMMRSTKDKGIDNVFIISHNHVERAFTGSFFHNTVEETMAIPKIGNGEVVLIEQDESNKFVRKNLYSPPQRTKHMPKDYKTGLCDPEASIPPSAEERRSTHHHQHILPLQEVETKVPLRQTKDSEEETKVPQEKTNVEKLGKHKMTDSFEEFLQNKREQEKLASEIAKYGY